VYLRVLVGFLVTGFRTTTDRNVKTTSARGRTSSGPANPAIPVYVKRHHRFVVVQAHNNVLPFAGVFGTVDATVGRHQAYAVRSLSGVPRNPAGICRPCSLVRILSCPAYISRSSMIYYDRLPRDTCSMSLPNIPDVGPREGSPGNGSTPRRTRLALRISTRSAYGFSIASLGTRSGSEIIKIISGETVKYPT